MLSSELAVEMSFSSVVVIVVRQSSTFCTLPSDNENVSDGKENEKEINRKSHSPNDDEV